MKIFTCGKCGNALHFNNRHCLSCGARLGFSPDIMDLCALEPSGDCWQPVGQPDQPLRFCENASQDICNWLVAHGDPNPYCRACRYNRMVPNKLQHWRRMSEAQRHLFYSFLKWKLPSPGRTESPEGGLVFDFMEDTIHPDGSHAAAMTGHDEGRIIIRAAEADDLTREQARILMNEPYRTLLGHFRHETGHFIWDQLIRDGDRIEECRAVFGDESVDYEGALQRHYQEGPPLYWQETHISAYATTHPWEDFAECFAHVLHIVDSVETAHSYGIALAPAEHSELAARLNFDPYSEADFERIADAWVRLSTALNAIHHSMGERDLYPFLLTAEVRRKLSFVHSLLVEQARHPAPHLPETANGSTQLSG